MDSTAANEVQKLVQKYVQVLGIEDGAVAVYVELLRLGPSSALQLAKVTDISRTQVYRHLEQLQSHRLVSSEQLSYGTLFRAQPIENLEASIASRETETVQLRGSITAMSEALQTLAGASGPQSTSHHYYGVGGLKQVNWNLAKAEKEFKVFEVGHLTEHLDKEARLFARRCRERCMERELTSYDLTNATSVSASELDPFEPRRTFIRHIDPEILKINFEVYLYNNVVTLIDYSPQQAQATEIYHPALKAMMTQLFDSMWRIATPLEIE